MSNMGDRRFEDTCCDLLDYLDALCQYQPVSESKHRAAYQMIRHSLCFYKDAGIIRPFDREAVIRHLDQIREEPAVPQASVLDGPQQPV